MNNYINKRLLDWSFKISGISLNDGVKIAITAVREWLEAGNQVNQADVKFILRHVIETAVQFYYQIFTFSKL